MKNKTNKSISRRNFISTTVLGAAGVAIFPSLVACNKKKTADDNIKLGFIGVGRQAMFLLNGFIGIENVKVIAACDVYGVKRARFEKKVKAFYAEKGIKTEVPTYEKYEDLLAREDIDAVVIAVPDHSHAMIAIAACKAGKDVYLEKPLTFTIKEGQELRRIVRENNRILAVGSQQRSDPNFQHAVKMAQSGALGEITKVNAFVGAPPTPYNLPEEPVPSDLNWDLWLANLNPTIHYNHELNPPITVNPDKDETSWGAWRWYKECGGGFSTDWGAHMFDIAQWGLGMDESGPVEISPIGDGTEFIEFKYANGVIMTSEPFNEQKTKGVKFTGTKGWIEVSREHFLASEESLMPPKKEDADGPYETKVSHLSNFIDSVVKRVDPVVPVEIGHRSCTVCTLGNIAVDLNRTVKWNPETETFVDDVDGKATAKMHYKYRDGWSLL